MKHLPESTEVFKKVYAAYKRAFAKRDVCATCAHVATIEAAAHDLLTIAKSTGDLDEAFEAAMLAVASEYLMLKNSGAPVSPADTKNLLNDLLKKRKEDD